MSNFYHHLEKVVEKRVDVVIWETCQRKRFRMILMKKKHILEKKKSPPGFNRIQQMLQCILNCDFHREMQTMRLLNFF